MYYQSVNGKQEQYISITNRGLAYGDGVFTTAKVLNGKVQLLAAHLERLMDSCLKLHIALPDMDKVAIELIDVAQRFELAVLKVIITAGLGGRGYSRQGCSSSMVIITFHPFPEHYHIWQTKGVELGLSNFKLGLNPSLMGLKHLNRLEQVMIRRELDHQPEDDLLVTNISGHIVETSCANIFWLKAGQYYTPDLSESGVEGLIRNIILKNIPSTHIVKTQISNLDNIEAMFICNSVMGIIPVRRYLNSNLDINKVLAIKGSLMSTIEC
ncbi:MAG: aminodeoxychorismate lyase [Colwellia sp.]|nr:aminodeoxychorismate lyase [Colwellia sp.]